MTDVFDITLTVPLDDLESVGLTEDDLNRLKGASLGFCRACSTPSLAVESNYCPNCGYGVRTSLTVTHGTPDEHVADLWGKAERDERLHDTELDDE